MPHKDVFVDPRTLFVMCRQRFSNPCRRLLPLFRLEKGMRIFLLSLSFSLLYRRRYVKESVLNRALLDQASNEIEDIHCCF